MSGAIGHNKTVLLYEASMTPANSRAYDGVCRYAEQAGWIVQKQPYSLAAAKRTHGRAAKGLSIPEALELWHPDGIIVECAGRPTQLPLEEFGNLPVVLLDSCPQLAEKRSVCVYTDAVSIAREAARELFHLGLSEFAYLPYTEDTLWSRNREEEFARLVRESGLKLHHLSVPRGKTNAVRLVEFLMPQIKALGKPCGIFAANDEMGRAAISACEALGVGVPEDVAVVGTDDDESLCENAAISLSSVRVDFDAAGSTAARLLDLRMGDRRKRVESVAMTAVKVVRRASSNRIRAADMRVTKALEYIRRNATRGIGPLDVVREMGCSRRLADLRFMEAVGHTVFDEIHAVRIERVKDLLMKPGQEVFAIPNLCGYGSLADLCRDFKKRTGQTLRGWRSSGAR